MRYSWQSSFGCEGGPAMVADADSFVGWSGAEPYPKGRQRTVHFWGQFTSTLSPRFQPCGPNGHQYLHRASYDDAVAEVHALIADVRARHRQVRVSGDGPWSVRLWNGKAMTITLEPESAYAEMCAALDEVVVHPIVEGLSACFWEVEGGCVVEVGECESAFVLLRSWSDGDDARLRAVVEDAAAGGQPAGELEVTSGVVVCAWSPVSASDLTTPSVSSLRAVAEQGGARSLDMPMHLGVGTALIRARGRYKISQGTHDDGAASCRWCRFDLLD